MKRFGIFVAVALALGLIAGIDAQDAKKLSDGDIAKLLVGTWQNKRTVLKQVVIFECTYKKDGTYTSRHFTFSEPTTVSDVWTGTWKVVEGELETVLVKTSEPHQKRFEGLTFVEKILSIDGSILKTNADLDGKRLEFKRIMN